MFDPGEAARFTFVKNPNTNFESGNLDSNGYTSLATDGARVYLSIPSLGEVEVVKGAKIIKDDHLGKKGDTPKEGTFADLAEGTPVLVQLSVDRKRALGIAIHGELLLSQRHEGEPVAVDDAHGNVIFTLVVEGPAHPILEVDGTISVVPKDAPSSRTRRRVRGRKPVG